MTEDAKFWKQHAEILRVKAAYYERLCRESKTGVERESYAETSALCRRIMLDMERVEVLLDMVTTVD